MTYCRRHLRDRAIAESLADAPWVDEVDRGYVPPVDALDLLPGTYEELVAWGLGLEVEDLPGWGTALDLAGLRVFSVV